MMWIPYPVLLHPLRHGPLVHYHRNSRDYEGKYTQRSKIDQNREITHTRKRVPDKIGEIGKRRTGRKHQTPGWHLLQRDENAGDEDHRELKER